jgi:hypothetical protein
LPKGDLPAPLRFYKIAGERNLSAALAEGKLNRDGIRMEPPEPAADPDKPAHKGIAALCCVAYLVISLLAIGGALWFAGRLGLVPWEMWSD